MIGLFCRISSVLQGSFAKETWNIKEPTNRSHPIPVSCSCTSEFICWVRNSFIWICFTTSTKMNHVYMTIFNMLVHFQFHTLGSQLILTNLSTYFTTSTKLNHVYMIIFNSIPAKFVTQYMQCVKWVWWPFSRPVPYSTIQSTNSKFPCGVRDNFIRFCCMTYQDTYTWWPCSRPVSFSSTINFTILSTNSKFPCGVRDSNSWHINIYIPDDHSRDRYHTRPQTLPQKNPQVRSHPLATKFL